MKKIVWNDGSGALMITTPMEGARLAKSITFEDGKVMASPRGFPVSVDQFLRGWPVAGVVAEWAETEEEWIRRVAIKSIPGDATEIHVVDESEIPSDREFRDALVVIQGKVEHDMGKCVEIHKRRLREMRAPKLAALDADYMKALEAGDTARMTAIAKKKQALRDVTADPALGKAATPTALKAVVPEALRNV